MRRPAYGPMSQASYRNRVGPSTGLSIALYRAGRGCRAESGSFLESRVAGLASSPMGRSIDSGPMSSKVFILWDLPGFEPAPDRANRDSWQYIFTHYSKYNPSTTQVQIREYIFFALVLI